MKMEKECFCMPWVPSATKAIFGNLLFPCVLFEQRVLTFRFLGCSSFGFSVCTDCYIALKG